MLTLTRRYRFSASHRLHALELSAAENARIYGKCNNPFGHGHDYILEVTVFGKINPVTGLVVAVTTLDRLVSENILNLFSHRNINLDVPQFCHLVPTTENLVLVIARLLEDRWPSYFETASARLERVFIQETDRNSFEVHVCVRNDNSARDRLPKSVTVHA